LPVFAGVIALAMFLAAIVMSFVSSPDMIAVSKDALYSRAYITVIFLNLVFTALFSIAFLNLPLGIWLALGRTHVTIDKKERLIRKSYCLLSFAVSERRYDTRRVSALSFDRLAGKTAFVWSYCISLHAENQAPTCFLRFSSAFESEGRALTNEIASFLGIPGPESAAS
jgi:hypothetical protein